MRFSIVIASLNEGFRLWKTVKGCLVTTKGLDREVVVADDGSRDGSIEELQRRFPEVRVFRSPRRRGCSPTKDMAARHARGQVLVFLDGHCKPEPGAIARLVADVERQSGRAMVTPSVPVLNERSWRNSTARIGHGMRVDLQTLGTNWLALGDLARLPPPSRPVLYKSPTFCGCCGAISRSLYEKLGGFDPDMRMWGVEDVDFGLKAWLMGYAVLHDPKAVIGHRFRKYFDNYPVPVAHVLANQLRMARKNLTELIWEEWVKLARSRTHRELWRTAWKVFASRRASVERERSYLMRHRVRDEFWYAAEFGLAWPDARQLTSSASRATDHKRTVRPKR